jgi:hypothetical protein
MELANNMFDNFNRNSNSSEKIILKIKKGEWTDIYKGLCHVTNNSITMEYIYFKHFATKDTYPIIQRLLTNSIETILLNNNNFIFHVNMKHLTISEIDKHRDFIQDISKLLKDNYPNKLYKCYVYNAPFIFSQVLNIISLFVDKETITKIEVIINNK